jgi:hypothetical protein
MSTYNEIPVLSLHIRRHQVDALGFMTDREIGELRNPMRYWSSGIDEDGTLVYVVLYVLVGHRIV